MQTLRSLLFAVWMYGWLAVLGLLWLPSLLLPRGAALAGARLFARLTAWGLAHIAGVRTEWRGLDRLPERAETPGRRGGYLLAAKHYCMWDAFAPFLVLPDPVIILKRELMWYPVFGWYAAKLDMVTIDRSKGVRAVREIAEAASRAVAEGRQLLIFPEGTRVRPGDAPDYKAAGLAMMHRKAEAPLVPVASNAGLFWPRSGVRRHPGTITYEILAPLGPNLSKRELMAQVEKAIETATARLLAEGGRGAPRDASGGPP